MALRTLYVDPGAIGEYVQDVPHIVCQVSIPFITNIPEDVAVNNWSFEVATADEANAAQCGEFLYNFYSGIASYYSTLVEGKTPYTKFYDRSDPEPRSPFLEGPLTGVTFPGDDPLPSEVACCLSFRGVLVSGQPPARRRGRVYLGPLGRSVMENETVARPGAPFRSAVLAAYEDAWTALTTAGNVHEVWSPTSSQGHTVVQAWTDNAFDTQRSRGVRATARAVTNGPW